MITRSKLARAAASVILAGVLVTSTAGCGFFTTQATLIPYDPSDGVGANLGSVDVRNVIGITDNDGESISLLVTFVNSGDENAKVTLQYDIEGKKTTITKVVGADEVVGFGNSLEEDQIVISGSGIPAGDLLPVYMQYGDNEGKQLLVPVLHAHGSYEELAPRIALGE